MQICPSGPIVAMSITLWVSLASNAFAFSNAPSLPSSISISRQELFAAASDMDEITDIPRRRELLLSAGAALTVSSLAMVGKDSSPWLPTMLNSQSGFVPVSTLDQALQIVATRVDKRYLHALVASDHEGCLWVNMGRQATPVMGIQTGLVTLNTDQGSLGLARSLDEGIFSDRPIDPTVSQWAWTSSPRDASQVLGASESSLVALWPLGGTPKDAPVHYAWSEDGGVLLDAVASNSKIIVDGIDCGRMSLEDALVNQQQVLIQAPAFLVVPFLLHQVLVEKVGLAYLI